VKQHDIMEDFVNKDSILSTNNMFTKILIWALSIELIGFILIFILVDSSGFSSTGDHFFFSIFHAVSGYNSAGITTLNGGVMNELVHDNYGFQLVILGLFTIGGLGMLYIFDLFEPKRILERFKYPWKGLQFGTKLTLYITGILFLAGAVIFFLFEKGNALEGQPWYGKIVSTLFQSMTTRSAGFNVVDTSSLALPTLIFFLFLMFVGGGSGSSAGGIRVSTFGIMFASVISTIRRKPYAELFKRTISNELVMKSYSIFIFYIVGNLVGIFLLVITESDAIESGAFTLIDIIFEHVSASATCGLSTGITSELSESGKYIIIFAMFIGRVGTLTLAYLLGRQVLSKNYKYPSGHTMIG
jgi:trk system potassium uptake protein TrkH